MSMEALLEMYAAEPLHEDLQPYVETNTIGQMIRHPLVMGFYHEAMNRQFNQSYAYKTNAIAQAKASEKWNTVIMLHERAYRLDAFSEICTLMSDKDYWKNLAMVWVDSENIFQNLEQWIELWNSDRAFREHSMSKSEQEYFNSLPETLAVYRGSAYETSLEGLSWTLAKDRAEWFAERFSNGREIFIARGTVKKSSVLAYFSGRNEEEIVVMPEDVEVEC